MSGGGEYQPPGPLKRLLDMAGGWLYAIAISFGWQPGGKPEDRRNDPPPG